MQEIGTPVDYARRELKHFSKTDKRFGILLMLYKN